MAVIKSCSWSKAAGSTARQPPKDLIEMTLGKAGANGMASETSSITLFLSWECAKILRGVAISFISRETAICFSSCPRISAFHRMDLAIFSDRFGSKSKSFCQLLWLSLPSEWPVTGVPEDEGAQASQYVCSYTMGENIVRIWNVSGEDIIYMVCFSPLPCPLPRPSLRGESPIETFPTHTTALQFLAKFGFCLEHLCSPCAKLCSWCLQKVGTFYFKKKKIVRPVWFLDVEDQSRKPTGYVPPVTPLLSPGHCECQLSSQGSMFQDPKTLQVFWPKGENCSWHLWQI